MAGLFTRATLKGAVAALAILAGTAAPAYAQQQQAVLSEQLRHYMGASPEAAKPNEISKRQAQAALESFDTLYRFIETTEQKLADLRKEEAAWFHAYGTFLNKKFHPQTLPYSILLERDWSSLSPVEKQERERLKRELQPLMAEFDGYQDHFHNHFYGGLLTLVNGFADQCKALSRQGETYIPHIFRDVSTNLKTKAWVSQYGLHRSQELQKIYAQLQTEAEKAASTMDNAVGKCYVLARQVAQAMEDHDAIRKAIALGVRSIGIKGQIFERGNLRDYVTYSDGTTTKIWSLQKEFEGLITTFGTIIQEAKQLYDK